MRVSLCCSAFELESEVVVSSKPHPYPAAYHRSCVHLKALTYGFSTGGSFCRAQQVAQHEGEAAAVAAGSFPRLQRWSQAQRHPHLLCWLHACAHIKFAESISFV